jgi:TolB protein
MKRSALGVLCAAALVAAGEAFARTDLGLEPVLIAYAGGGGANQSIYVEDTGTDTSRRLTRSAGADSGPVWSPDGSRLAFTRRVDGVGAILVDRPVERRLSPRHMSASNPVWSPDGHRILFDGADRRHELYVVSSDGTGLIRMTTNWAHEGVGDWSPDGTEIAYTGGRLDEGRSDYDVYVMRSDGTAQRPVTHNTTAWGYWDRLPRWSPDGKRIAFYTALPGQDSVALDVIDADGSSLLRVARDAAGIGRPSWSPDGRRIAYATSRRGGYGISVASLNGDRVVRLTHHSPEPQASESVRDSFPAWSSGGGRIAFERRRGHDWRLCLVRVSSHTVDDLAATAAPTRAPAWQPVP